MPTEPSRTILVVDDDPLVLSATGDLCEALGYRVLRAHSGETALPLVGPGVDLLLTDVRMPGLDGLGLLRLVRVTHPTLPVIVMTAYGDLPELVAMRGLGIVGTLRKPFGVRDLPAMFRRVWPGPPPSAARAAAPVHRILLVDDETTVRGTLRVALEAKGHTVALAKDGREALRLLHQDRYALVFLGDRLPTFERSSVLRALKRKDPDVPVVFIAEPPDQAQVRSATAPGAAPLLEKLFTAADVDAVLGRVFKTSQPLTESFPAAASVSG